MKILELSAQESSYGEQFAYKIQQVKGSTVAQRKLS